MIHHQLDIEDNEQNIVRPFVLRIVDHVKFITGIKEDTDLIYAGLGETSAQHINPKTGRPDTVLETKAGLIIEVSTTYEEAMWSGQATHRIQHAPFFNDPDTPFSARPAYQDVVIQITATYVTHSYNEANRWRNAASRRVSQYGETHMHESSYHYAIPRWLWGIAKHIYDLREKRAGYGISFQEYINKHISPNVTQISTQSGNVRELAVRETQAGVQGVFDFTMEPEPVEKNVPDGNQRVRFGYRVTLSVPTHISITHPLVVHNSLVDEKFIPKNMLQYNNVAQRASLLTSALQLFECDNALRQHIPEIPLFRSPAYDLWQPNGEWNYYRMYGSFLFGVTESSGDVLVDLNDLGNYQLSEATKAWMKGGAYKSLQIPYMQPFYVCVYENEALMPPDAITIDKDLKVRATRPLNMRGRYRLVISLLLDITKLNPESMKDAANYGDFLCTFLKTINAATGDLYRFALYVDLDRFKVCVHQGGVSLHDVQMGMIHMNTAMTGYIETSRRP